MLSTVRSNKTAYAFTIKDVRRETTDYVRFWDRLSKFNVDIDCKYKELDSKGKVHYHGILLIPKGLYRQKLMMPGLHMKLEELYDRAGWMKYITKDQEANHSDVPQTPNGTPNIQYDELIEETPIKLTKRYV